MEEKRLFTVAEIAKDYRLSPRSLRKAIHDGELPSAKKGLNRYLSREDVETWIRKTATTVGKVAP